MHNNVFLRHCFEITWTFIRAKHDFNNPSELPGHPITKGASVSSISKYFSESRKLVLQLLYDLRCTSAIMQIGFVDGHSHWNAKCVNHNVFLAPFDFFVSVNPSI